MIPLIIKPSIQNYHWGKIGGSSLVARLSANFNPALPYAELWYGSHPKAPSLVHSLSGSRSLVELLQNNSEEILGLKTKEAFGQTLPFLAKVLSIDKALSIQAHPDKRNAKILHSKDPVNYPDENHKPEIAVALTEVKLLHGWISAQEVPLILAEFPDLRSFLIKHKIDLSAWDPESRKQLVTNLFKAPAAEMAALSKLFLTALSGKSGLSKKQNLFLSLAEQVEPVDVGLLLSLFLRQLTLAAGESLFTPAGEIHAYLSGDLFECMANSDNVIRAGLTPKFQDIEALLSCANFEEGSCQTRSPSVDLKNSGFLAYFSEAAEFKVLSVTSNSKTIQYSKTPERPELLVLLEGSARIKSGEQDLDLHKGDGVLVPAGMAEVSLELDNASLFRVVVPFGAVSDG